MNNPTSPKMNGDTTWRRWSMCMLMQLFSMKVGWVWSLPNHWWKWSHSLITLKYWPLVHCIKILGPPIDNWKALCVNKFMERHGISAVEDLIQDLTSHQQDELSHIYNLNLPQSDFNWLRLLVTVDSRILAVSIDTPTYNPFFSSQVPERILMNSSQLKNTTLINICKHLLGSLYFSCTETWWDNLILIRFYICCTSVTTLL